MSWEIEKKKEKGIMGANSCVVAQLSMLLNCLKEIFGKERWQY